MRKLLFTLFVFLGGSLGFSKINSAIIPFIVEQDIFCKNRPNNDIIKSGGDDLFKAKRRHFYSAVQRKIEQKVRKFTKFSESPGVISNLPVELPWTGSTCNGNNIILQNGIGALTCGVTTATPSADRWAFAYMNFDDIIPSSGRSEQTPLAEVYHHPSWHVDSIGNVFGVAMNTGTGEVFITASTNYGSGFLGNNAVIRFGAIAGGTTSGSNDSAAGGAVYKIDAVTGQATVFSMLPQQETSVSNTDCETGISVMRTNSGTGLGNIVYDEDNDQYFVSNIEDGRIYRLSNTGAVLDSYDPFSDDDGAAGISDIEELVYGLAKEPGADRLFFGGVDYAPGADQFAEIGSPGIYSITLLADGSFPGTINNTNMPVGATYNNYEQPSETFHTNIPTGSGASYSQNYVYLISDLAFSQNGTLLAGTRVSCEGSFFSSYNHWSETNEITKNSGTNIYDGSVRQLDITFHGDAAPEDTYGGVATYVDGLGNNIMAVSASDILTEDGPHGIAVFNDSPNSGSITPLAAVSYGLIGTDPKGVGGDIDIWTGCICVNPVITATDTDGCSGETLVQITADVPGGTWTMSSSIGTMIDPAGNVTLGINSTGSDVVDSVFYTMGCAADTALITIFPSPNIISVRDTCVCEGRILNLDLLLEHDNGTGTLTYHSTWADAISNSNAFGATVSVSDTITYYVRKTFPSGCYDTDSISVNLCEFDLALKKELLNTAPVYPGGKTTFEIKVYNQGSCDASQIIIHDYIPVGFTLRDLNWNNSNDTQIAVDTISMLAAGDSALLIIALQAGLATSGNYINNAEIVSAIGGTDTDSPLLLTNNGMNNELSTDNDIDDNGIGTPGTSDNVIDEDDYDPAPVIVECPVSVCLPVQIEKIND